MARGHPDFLRTAGKTAAGEQKIDWDFLVNNGKLIGGTSGVLSNAEETLYTVPTAKIAFIVQASIYFEDDQTVGKSQHIITIGEKEILAIRNPAVAGEHAGWTTGFVIPVKLTADQIIKVTSNISDVNVVGSFIGYEIDA